MKKFFPIAACAALLLVLFFNAKQLHAQEATMLKDVNTRSAFFYSPHSYTPYNGKMYYLCYSNDNDNNESGDMVETNGTNKETLSKPVKLINSSGMISYKGNLYYNGSDSLVPNILYKYDGVQPPKVALNIYKDRFLAPVDTVNGKIILNGYDSLGHSVLWVSDGENDSNTFKLANIKISSYYYPTAVFDNVLYFAADDSNYQTRFWRTDGSIEGTYIVPYYYDAPEFITVYNGKVYFSAPSYGTGYLYSTDGMNGVELVSYNCSGVSYPVVYNGLLYFSAHSRNSGTELWESDGTSAGTKLVADINPGDKSSNPSYLVASGAYIYFSANDGVHGSELWRSDGTADGTKLVKDLIQGEAGSKPKDLTDVDGTLYGYYTVGYPARDIGFPLFKSDGTKQGTVMIDSLRKSEPNSFFGFNGKLYFSVDYEQWVSDGSNKGTHKLVVHNIGNGSGFFLWGYPGVKSINSTLYFKGYDRINGGQVWKSDGTPNGTSLISIQLPPKPNKWSGNDPYGFLQFNNSLVYERYASLDLKDSYFSEYNLYITDGTAHGTVELYTKNTNAGAYHQTVFQNSIYFNSYGLWKSDGTPKGTVLIKSLNADAEHLFPTPNYILFNYNDGRNGGELWISNGTFVGTFLLKDISPGSASSYPNSFFWWNHKTYFIANVGTSLELWETNGTSAGTKRDAVLNNEGNEFDWQQATMDSVDNKLVFRLLDQLNLNIVVGDQLWEFDKNTGTAVLLKQFGSDYYYLTSTVHFKNASYFEHSDGVNGTQIWRSDGTEKGTFPIFTNTPNSILSDLTILNNKLYFTAQNGDYDYADVTYDTYESDGTEEGTNKLSITSNGEPLKNIVSGTFGNYLVLQGYSYDYGWEPYIVNPRGTGNAEIVTNNNSPALPSTNGYLQCYPQPATNHITFTWQQEEEGNTLLVLRNLEGIIVSKVADKELQAGQQSFSIDVGDLPRGAYIAELVINGNSALRKIVLQ